MLRAKAPSTFAANEIRKSVESVEIEQAVMGCTGSSSMRKKPSRSKSDVASDSEFQLMHVSKERRRSERLVPTGNIIPEGQSCKPKVYNSLYTNVVMYLESKVEH
mgnify:CR=1 FL=1